MHPKTDLRVSLERRIAASGSVIVAVIQQYIQWVNSVTTDHTTSPANRPFRNLVLLGLGWQFIPAAWLMWDAWDSPSSTTIVLRLLVFLFLPVLAGIIHKSWQVAVAVICLPIFAIGVESTVFMLIMPVGKW